MKRLVVVLLHFIAFSIQAQPKVYTAAQIHAHNDYEKAIPFLTAYHRGVGSIEVDVFLHEGGLVVAHDSAQLGWRRSLDSLYRSRFNIYHQL